LSHKKKVRNNDLVLTTVYKERRCPSCRKKKDDVIHFLHKNILHSKIILELLLCKDCIVKNRNEIIEKKAKNHFYLIPIFNTMLKAIDFVPEELSIDQIAELMNENSKKVEVEKEKLIEDKESVS